MHLKSIESKVHDQATQGGRRKAPALGFYLQA
jgi:hypothetical protein